MIIHYQGYIPIWYELFSFLISFNFILFGVLVCRMGKCTFQERWLQDPNFKSWIRPDEDKYKAFCKLCKSSISVVYNGQNALMKHRQGKNHIAREKPLIENTQTTLNVRKVQSNISVSYEPVDVNNSETQNDSNIKEQSKPLTSTTTSVLNKFLRQKEAQKAEIIWAISRILCHKSTRDAEFESDLFPVMFSDSQIAADFKMKKDKVSYVMTYGLGPFYENKLLNRLQDPMLNCYALSVDECLNKVCCKGQMDLILRFWDVKEDKLMTRYLTSVFLEECDADTLLTSITNTLNKFGLSLAKIIQLALDGPNVNLKLFRIFVDFMKKAPEPIACKILDVGTCSIHIVHNSYKTAHKKVSWTVNEFLRSCYFLLKDFPTRRAAYRRLGKSKNFPLKFCTIRWLENVPVLKQGLKILDPVRAYIKGVEKKPPNSKTYHNVKTYLQDDFLKAKMHFLLTIAEECFPFLLKFQSNNALFPFLYDDMYDLVRIIGKKFMKEIFLKGDISNDNLKDLNHVDIGFGAMEAIKGKKIVHVLKFRTECRNFLKEMFQHLVAKCPLTNEVVQGASALNPVVMTGSLERRERRITKLLSSFVSAGSLCEASLADRIKREYLNLCKDNTVIDYLKKFNSSYKLDEYLLRINEFHPLSKDFTSFMKIVFILFPSNAAVERSFSVNKECLVENLTEESLVAQRIVYDSLKEENNFDLKTLDISRSMIQYVQNASSKRNESLKIKQIEKESEADEKKKLSQELSLLKARKQKLEERKEEEMKMILINIAFLEKKLKK